MLTTLRPALPGNHAMTDNERALLAHITDKARDAAAGGFDALSTGEQLVAALVLNRPDWLASMGYTIAQAIDRLGPSWVAQIPAAGKQLAKDAEAVADVMQRASYDSAAESLLSGEEIELRSELVTYSMPNGYRDVTFVFDVEQALADGVQKSARIRLRIRPEDAAPIVRQLHEVHASAWRNGERPLDAKDGETRPSWLDHL